MVMSQLGRGVVLGRRTFIRSSAQDVLTRGRDSLPFDFQRLTISRFTSSYLNTGHIETQENEGILFFNSVFPRKLQWLLRYPFFSTHNLEQLHERGSSAQNFDPVGVFEHALESSNKKDAAAIQSVTPLVRDGGAFVKFSHSPEITNADVVSLVRRYQEEHSSRPWWNPLDQSLAHLVQGRPWIEDLYRPPCWRLKVEFEPEGAAGGSSPELSQEQLYSLLRPYGKLDNIRPQPTDSKVLPRYAIVDFTSNKHAITAKNCLHGYIVRDDEGTGKGLVVRIKMSYEYFERGGWAKDWIVNHPRIAIPILAALAAFIASVVFDPIRTAFVKLRVTQALHISDNRIVKWVMSWKSSVLGRSARQNESSTLTAIWTDRRSHIETLEKWLMETADTFIVVQGPRGSGKRDLVVTQALKSRPNKLIIDCKRIQDARGDTATINAMAEAVNYKPVFSWMNSMSGMIDLAAQGATGVKTGFSETLDGQLNQILRTSTNALRSTALQDRDKKKDKDGHLADDDYLEAHPEKRPVVVIDNFLHRASSADDNNNTVYDKLAEWAADLTSANVAHVIFLTTDVSFAKSLSKALPDRVFRQISLGDLPADAAKRFVVSHLDAEPEDVNENGEKAKRLTPSQRRKDLSELDDCIDSLGGRLTDLEFLSRRIRSGESPRAAVKGIIDQSASEILKMYVLGSRDDRSWSAQQAWVLIKELAKQDGTLKYNEMLLDSAFSSTQGPATLAALEQAELIAVKSAGGRPSVIKPGKPVFLQAFRILTEDKVLSARMNAAILAEKIKTANAGIDKHEEELKLLGQLPKQPAELSGRTKYLLTKIQDAQASVEKLEKEVGDLQKILSAEY